MTDTSGALDLSATVNSANGRDLLAAMKGLYAQDQKILGVEAKDPKIAADRAAVSDAADKSTKDVHAAYDGIEKVGDRLKPWDAQKELSDRQANPIQAFGSLGAIFAAAASLFTHTPAINAMNGMAAAVNAVKANDEESYKKGYEAWRENYQLAIERHRVQHEDYEDAMSMADHDINATKAKLLADSAKYDDALMRSKLEMGDLEKISQIQQARDSSARGWAEVAPQIEAFHEHMDQMFAAQKELLPAYLKTPQGQQFLAQNPKFDPNNPDMKKLPKDFIGAAALLTQQKEAQAKRAGGGTTMSAQEARAVDDLVASGIPREDAIAKVARSSKGGGDNALSGDELKEMGQQYLAGDKSVFQNIGRGVQGADNIKALRGEIARQMGESGMSGADMAAKIAEFGGVTAGERTLGTRTANVGLAVDEARSLAPLAIDASRAVARTKFTPLNSAIQAVESGSSDPDLARFVTANNSLINVYARGISPTGVPTVSDKDHGREMLSTAKDQASYEAVVNQMMKELAAAQTAPGQVRGELRDAVTGKGASGVPAVGTVEGGHRFKGGDPADPNSWEAVQ